MAVPEQGGWNSFFSGATNLYVETLKAKTAASNATAATANKGAIEAQLNAVNTSDKGIDQKTMLLIAGGGVLLVGAIIALK